MSQNAIIVHGKPSRENYYADDTPASSNFGWIPWLQKQLIIRDIKADTPEMPMAFEPRYALWRTELERFDITPETILVGHSAGGGFLVRWLSENPGVHVGKVVLVAPSIDPAGTTKTGFYDFDIDPLLARRTAGLIIFASDNDVENISESVRILSDAIAGCRVVELAGFGHFLPDQMGTDAFPHLLEAILD